MRVDAELNELSDEIKALGEAQSKITAMRERIDYLNNLGQNRIHSLKFLKELTEVLPDTVWLSGLSVAGSKVEIQGYADYSTRLITGLEGLFKISFEISRQ
jgi:Tfp pilus assembly protein PilN